MTLEKQQLAKRVLVKLQDNYDSRFTRIEKQVHRAVIGFMSGYEEIDLIKELTNIDIEIGGRS